MILRFQPKGSMCKVCAYKNNDCSELPFFEMLPVIERYKEKDESGKDIDILIVRCEEFQRLQ